MHAGCGRAIHRRIRWNKQLYHEGNEDELAQRTTLSEEVSVIHADLTSGPDLRLAQRLRENAGQSFEGVKPAGEFDLPGTEARSWLDLPNPSGVSNADVLKSYISGEDITDGSKDRWTVDFSQMELEDAQKYRRPMQHVVEKVKPEREDAPLAAERGRASNAAPDAQPGAGRRSGGVRSGLVAWVAVPPTAQVISGAPETSRLWAG